MLTIKFIFWSSLILIFYTYFGYPLLLKFISCFRSRTISKAQIFPPVTFIITAHNEEATIRSKIENTLSFDYPKEKLQIIVASDASDDATDAYVSEYKNKGVDLVSIETRKGKDNAQKHAVKKAKGDILIFSDVATILNPEAIRNIVSNFNDPIVGCVSSEDKVISDDGRITGENLYVKYEMLLRILETRVNSLVSLSGSFFAARKEVCQNWAEDLQSDFNTMLNSIKIGFRGISDPESIGYYKNVISEDQEFNRKIRTVLRGISVLMSRREMLNPFKYGLFSLQLISHKLFRWFIPFTFILVFMANLFLIGKSPFYFYLFILQITFYTLALIGFTYKSSGSMKIFKIPLFFTGVNFSILLAWYKYLKGERSILWEPSHR